MALPCKKAVLRESEGHPHGLDDTTNAWSSTRNLEGWSCVAINAKISTGHTASHISTVMLSFLAKARDPVKAGWAGVAERPSDTPANHAVSEARPYVKVYWYALG